MDDFVLIFQGLLLNWTVEKQVWDYVFGKDAMKVQDFKENSLLSDFIALRLMHDVSLILVLG